MMAAAALSACSDTTSNPAPPRLTEPLSLPEQPSTLRIPVGIPLATIEREINAEIPATLYRIDEPQRVCVKTESKLLPDVTCRLRGQVVRGPIRLSGAGNVLNLAMPVRTTVYAENIGKLIKRETATGAMNVTARVRLGLAPDWTPRANIDADYAWTNKIGIDFLGQRIEFADKVDPELRKVLAQLERTLPAKLDRVQAKREVAKIWAKGFTSVRVKSDPLIWARFTPQRIGLAGYSIRDGQLSIGFAAQARTETIFGDRPKDPPVTPLPNLMRGLPPGGINVHVPVLVRYDVLEAAALRELQSIDYRKIKLKGGAEVDAEYRNVTIYGTPDRRVAVGVGMTVKAVSGAFTTKGKVWFIARPAIDIDKRIVGIADLQVSGETDSKAFNLLLDAVNRTALRERMAQAVRYNFARDYDEGLRKADAWLEEQPFEGFVFKGEMTGAQLRRLRVAPDGFLVEADAQATAAMRYDPARASQLVAQRRARREARREARTEAVENAVATAKAAGAIPR
ncbi:hypothetical protein BFL28_14980 [Sphingomonas turrisvirgatae]|uniref:DUF4403 domain-containing protein n=2 Tax=Sphingomonas turrisvirgatae TaxID=1888892 RepID=A0A1E3LYT6_9SPHN|nr:hypothetical protein BFL28_14980 [Sphingomonas turrisvirgatae]